MNIIELAKQAGIKDAHFHAPHLGVISQLKSFASLVEAAARSDEREECAKIADEWDKVNKLCTYGAFIAFQIRARSGVQK